LPTILTLFGYFHILTYQALKLLHNTKTARYVSYVHYVGISHMIVISNRPDLDQIVPDKQVARSEETNDPRKSIQ